ncbi:protein disulfide oxidoreductase [Salinivibrio kushneri]|uniref:Protein disulfide oxidoreductase n=1 Tax=Salinivibrio kushneri TaxID=1908198 RepID=A0AA47KJE9_9GAMM|nr:protein disulfide oxidoreductase [Salinivibrio kushneri]WBA07991.1 protein disulfide oxidoreductase [Salinivibrio kushneri]
MTAKQMKRSWRKRVKRGARDFCWLIVFVLISSTAMDWWRSRDIDTSQMPVESVRLLDGRQQDLVAMSQQKPVLVYVWASWCGVCRFVTPSVDWLSGHAQVVSIALRSGSDKHIAGYLAHHDYEFPVVNDQHGNLSDAFSVKVTPTVMVVEQGKITSITTGFTTPLGLWLRLVL